MYGPNFTLYTFAFLCMTTAFKKLRSLCPHKNDYYYYYYYQLNFMTNSNYNIELLKMKEANSCKQILNK